MIPTGSYVTAVTCREVRDLADLGGASRSLGQRWEHVGEAGVSLLLGQDLHSPAGETYRCLAVLQLHHYPEMLVECSGRSLKSPDCLFAGHDRFGRLILQPGDFKFTLDVATRAQIDPAPIRALIAHGGPLFEQALHDLLTRASEQDVNPDNSPHWLLAALDNSRARLLPGFFLTPDEPSNRLFLRQTSHRRRGGPRVEDVRFLPVSPATFFEQLPGTELAPLLQEVDGGRPQENDFPSATYYFQLGAAVRGAFELLRRPLIRLLGPAPELDTIAELQAYLAQRPAMWAIDVVRELAAPAIARRERLRMAQRLVGSPLWGRPAYEIAAEANWNITDEPGPRSLTKARFKLLLDQVESFHTQALADLLAKRQRSFTNDQALLSWLRDARSMLEPHDRAELLRLLAQAAPSHDLT